MVNILDKSNTHRSAIAEAVVRVSNASTIQAVSEKQVPKGDVIEMSKTAGLLAVKRTSDMIPDCHPLPIEFCKIHHELRNLEIVIRVEVHTIYKTGVEVEAMHGASVVALTIYDMLKPLDKEIVIERICLIEKSGGRSSYADKKLPDLNAAVVVCSDSVSSGKKTDRAGVAVIEKLKKCSVSIFDYTIIPDESETIKQRVLEYCSNGVNMVILSGGTGLSPRDCTTEALAGIIEIRIPGIEEAMRAYGQDRTPYSMLSRSIAGLIGNTLILGLPGSTRGAAESMDALFPAVLHIFKVMQGARHD